MFTDAQLAILRDSMGEEVQILDTDDSVLATVRGFFKRRLGDIDLGGPNYSEVPYEVTTEEVAFDCRTVDVTGSWVGKKLALTNADEDFAHREGATYAPRFTIIDRRDDGQGITKFILDR